MIELAIGLTALVALGFLALCFGHDSNLPERNLEIEHARWWEEQQELINRTTNTPGKISK
jgi:hypothetical protein